MIIESEETSETLRKVEKVNYYFDSLRLVEIERRVGKISSEPD